MSAYREIIVPIAKSLGCSDYAVEKWRVRGWVPHRWRLPILEAAKKRGKRLDVAAFDSLGDDVKRKRAAA